MPIYFGSNKIKEIYNGGTKIKEVYNGSNKVFGSDKTLKYCETSPRTNDFGNSFTFHPDFDTGKYVVTVVLYLSTANIKNPGVSYAYFITSSSWFTISSYNPKTSLVFDRLYMSGFNFAPLSIPYQGIENVCGYDWERYSNDWFCFYIPEGFVNGKSIILSGSPTEVNRNGLISFKFFTNNETYTITSIGEIDILTGEIK